MSEKLNTLGVIHETAIPKRLKGIVSGKMRDRIFICCMLAYPLLQFAIFWLGVNIGSITMTFQKFDWLSDAYVFNGLKNFEKVFYEIFNTASLQRTLLNSFLYMPVTNFISLPLSILFSYFLFKKVPLSPIFRVIFFLPSILPIVVLTMAFSFTFDSTYGPVNAFLKAMGVTNIPSWFGADPNAQIMIFVYCIWAGLGFNIILLSGAIGRIPSEVMEYSKLEGVGMSREIFTIIVPLIWPTITTTFLLGCTSMFTVMLQPMLLTPGKMETMTISLMIYNGVLGDRDLPYLTTLGLMLSLVGIPIIMGIRALLGKIYADVEY